jgi:hypothetical protein
MINEEDLLFLGSTRPMNLFMTHRNVGKSVFGVIAKNLVRPSVTVLDQTQVDQDSWYTVDIDPEIATWVRQQCSEHWYEHPGHRFRSIMEVHEHLYTLIRLKF